MSPRMRWSANKRFIPQDENRHADATFLLSHHQLRHCYQQAFVETISALSSRERNLLWQHIIEGMSLEEIGGFYAVSRITASHWMVTLRKRLTKQMYERMQNRLPHPTSTVQKLIHAQLDFSLSSYLGNLTSKI